METRPVCKQCKQRPCIINHTNKDGSKSYKPHCGRCQKARLRKQRDSEVEERVRKDMWQEVRAEAMEVTYRNLVNETSIMRRALAVAEVHNKKMRNSLSASTERLKRVSEELRDAEKLATEAIHRADTATESLESTREHLAAVQLELERFQALTGSHMERLNALVETETAGRKKWQAGTIAALCCFLVALIGALT
jgi:hypothetical protein